ncbi:MAG: hypothetical protein ACREIP_17385, partial [Alphaproteobacteria bacterium]
MRKKGGAPQLDQWRRSSEWRAMARSFCVQFNIDRKNKPKCGAKRKTDGEPCQNLGMKNGRCFRHGGKTPRGDNWHVTQWPNKRHPFATTKMEKKLQWQERRAATRAKRAAQMTPDELAAFEFWKQTHKPGKAAARELKRQDARNSADFRARSETSKSESVSEEAAELRAYRLH